MSRIFKSFFIRALMAAAVAIGLPSLSHPAAYAASRTPEQLRRQYDNRKADKVRILIVPGHDDEIWGTGFRGVKEADMNVVLAEELYALFKKDKRIEPVITRTKKGYAPEFSAYFSKETSQISAFIASHREKASVLKEKGELKDVGGVPHVAARPDVALKLFGINKWANENDIDIVLHIHFNDYPGRPWNMPGIHSGFTVYVPEEQYGNARVSRSVGQALYRQLDTKYEGSTLPGENTGTVTYDQELIAIGSNNTLRAASALIEYGYIYEHHFLATSTRKKTLKAMAYQTYLGIHRFFGDANKVRR